MEQTPDLSELMRLAQSPAGQKLLALLRQTGGPQLQDAVARASAKDYSGAKQAMSQLLDNPQIQQLLRQMEESK